MDTPRPTVRRFLFEVGTAYVLIIAGFFAAGLLAKVFTPFDRDMYGICLVPGCLPAVLWMKHCGVVDFKARHFWMLLALMIAKSVAIRWIHGPV